LTATLVYETQNRMVLSHLKTGKVITPLEALNSFGCFRLAARIYDLRTAGWPIHCDRIPMEGGKIVGHYTLHLDKTKWPKAGEID
jgi:hypothetical protein